MQAAAAEDADRLADDGPVSPTTPHDNSPASPDIHVSRPPPPSVHAAGQQADETSAVNEAISQTERTCIMLDGPPNQQAKGRANAQGQRPSHLGKRTLEAATLQV